MVPHRVFSGLLVVPNELVDKIVETMLAEGSNDQSHCKFARIASLTLSSSRLREIALRRFFHSLHPASSHHWSQLYKLLVAQGEQAFSWVRYVEVPHLLFRASRHAYIPHPGKFKLMQLSFRRIPCDCTLSRTYTLSSSRSPRLASRHSRLI
jgi:hypothetical protein